MREAIAGVPRAGKTTLAEQLGVRVRSTDETVPLGWSEASAEVAKWFDDEGDVVIEGVAVPRALRKWLAANPTGKPVDRIRWMDVPRTELDVGQRRMASGARTVFSEVVDELVRRGVTVEGWK